MISTTAQSYMQAVEFKIGTFELPAYLTYLPNILTNYAIYD